VTEEEYEEYLASESRPQNFQVAARVKEESLAFGEIFNELDALQTQSFEQISDLSSLLAEVNAYRVRLAKTPTIAPVEGRLTSHYGYRNSPVSGARRMHQGLDIAAPLGSPIRAAAAGIVTKVSRAPDYGKYVEIAHGHDVVTLYAHTRQILVKAGEQVAKGQLIALVGMTGRTTGPHLHYEIKVKGQRVNPYSYISGF
jgi:murein DD-endopeptidase MepM/ murein hydrolase activator NlpD